MRLKVLRDLREGISVMKRKVLFICINHDGKYYERKSLNAF